MFKINNLDFKLYIKTGKLKKILYLLAALVLLVPMAIVILTGIPLNSNLSKIHLNLAYIFVILGKLFSYLSKDKTDKTRSIDIGLMLGISIAFISHILK